MDNAGRAYQLTFHFKYAAFKLYARRCGTFHKSFSFLQLFFDIKKIAWYILLDQSEINCFFYKACRALYIQF